MTFREAVAMLIGSGYASDPGFVEVSEEYFDLVAAMLTREQPPKDDRQIDLEECIRDREEAPKLSAE